MTRWRTLETVAWLALYGCLLAFLLSWNSASPTWNAVFRERSSADWFEGASRAYTPGFQLTGSEPSPHFDGGWWRPERGARWGRGTHSGIVIEPTENIAAGGRIAVTLGAITLRIAPTQLVDVLVNGDVLETIAVGWEPRQFEIVLPVALPKDRPATITFIAQFAGSGLTLGYGLDQRELGVRLYDLAVLPAP